MSSTYFKPEIKQVEITDMNAVIIYLQSLGASSHDLGQMPFSIVYDRRLIVRVFNRQMKIKTMKNQVLT